MLCCPCSLRGLCYFEGLEIEWKSTNVLRSVQHDDEPRDQMSTPHRPQSPVLLPILLCVYGSPELSSLLCLHCVVTLQDFPKTARLRERPSLLSLFAPMIVLKWAPKSSISEVDRMKTEAEDRSSRSGAQLKLRLWYRCLSLDNVCVFSPL